MANGLVLVTGAAGYLGWYVARELVRLGFEVVGTSRDGEGMPPGVAGRALELDDGGAAGAALVGELAPARVLHLAARSQVEGCARDPDGATLVNAVATATLARAAVEAGARFLYTSTDLVFDGERAPYAEDDPPAPLGAYMESKAAGEREALAADPSALVVRVALLYGLNTGRGQGTFTDTLARRLRAGEPVDLFVDQRRTPAYVEDAAELLCALSAPGPAGVVHLGGPDRVSRLEHGLALARALGVDPALCRPARVADVAGLAPRPADVSLRCERLTALLGRAPIGVAEGCRRTAAQTA